MQQNLVMNPIFNQSLFVESFKKMITIRKFNPALTDDQVIQTAIKEHRKTLLQRTVNDIESNPELARKLGILKEVI